MSVRHINQEIKKHQYDGTGVFNMLPAESNKFANFNLFELSYAVNKLC